MGRERLLFVLLNLVGGGAVLGSYAWGLLAGPRPVEELWGGLPEGMRPLYAGSMLLAAAGYFAFSGFLLSRRPGEPAEPGWGLVYGLYGAILFPSALWMPFTFAYLESADPALEWAIRGVLAVAGLASVALLVFLARALYRAGWAKASDPHKLAVAGAAAFALQTGLLDAVVWPLCFFGS